MGQFANDKVLEHAITQYSGMIIRIAFQHTQNKADSEDIAQDVFFSLITQPPFETENHLKAWLIRATINKSKDYLKSARRRYTTELKENYIFAEQDKTVFDALK